MGISLNTDLNSVMSKLNVSESSTTKSSELSSKLSNLEHASEAELMEACKSFEAYFVEQVIKEVEKTIHTDDKDSYAAQMTDYFKDSVIQELSDKIIDQSGNSFTQKLYEQMRRNVGLPATEQAEAAVEKDEVDAVSAAEKMAGAHEIEDDEVEVTILE